MAIVDMSKVNIYGYKSSRKEVLEYLQQFGILEVCDVSIPEMYEKADMSRQISQFSGQMNTLKTAIEILDKYSPVKVPFYADKTLVSRDFAMNIRRNDGQITKKAAQIIELTRNIEEKNTLIQKNNMTLLSLNTWLDFDLPQNFHGTRSSVCITGALQGEYDLMRLEKLFINYCGFVPFIEILSASNQQTCFSIFAHKSDAESVENALKSMGYTKYLQAGGETPNEMFKMLKLENNLLIKNIEDDKSKIIDFAEKRLEIQALYDIVSVRKDKYSVINKLGLGKKTFILSGYVPKKEFDNLNSILTEQFGVYSEITELDAENGEEYPILFKNNAVVRPVETIVESFSMPSKTDVDPTAITAFFYYFYFGMMFSDAGYGLLVMIVCGFLGFFMKNVKPSLQNSMRMFFYCGISTTFWGILYGSFFGDAIGIISKGFFGGNAAFNPILFDPIKKPMELLILSIILGMMQILGGLVMKFITMAKNGDLAGAFFDAGLWIDILLGIGVFVSGMVFEIETVKYIGIGMILAGVGGRILFGGREQKNFILRLLMGIISLYDITGYLSDALSYSRLMALGLVTGAVASVTNTMGSLNGFGIGGAFMFFGVFIFGHSINFAINMLGAYIHTNRLQFVEFFGKFYEGGGRKFESFSMKSKYIKLDKYQEDK